MLGQGALKAVAAQKKACSACRAQMTPRLGMVGIAAQLTMHQCTFTARTQAAAALEMGPRLVLCFPPEPVLHEALCCRAVSGALHARSYTHAGPCHIAMALLPVTTAQCQRQLTRCGHPAAQTAPSRSAHPRHSGCWGLATAGSAQLHLRPYCWVPM